jgi:hypothetical protein
MLRELGELGVDLTERGAVIDGPKPLAGKTFVVTGTLATLTRDAARERIETLGGRVTSAVTRKTDYVVIGDAAGSKADDARRLGAHGAAIMTTRSLAVAALLALLLGGCLGFATDSPAPVDQSAPGRWTTAAPMPTARQEVAVAAYGGTVWVIGGFGPGAEPMATVERYDPASDSWDARPSLPIAIHHAAAVTVGDRLFVLGGYGGGRIRWTPLDNVYEWEEARGTWQARVPMPTPRGALAAVELNGRIHALGIPPRAAGPS